MLNYIINYFGLQFPEKVAPFAEFAFYVAMISLVVLICFINVFGYFMGYYIKDMPIIVNKYPDTVDIRGFNRIYGSNRLDLLRFFSFISVGSLLTG
ncbi:hypothetical protein Golomagni_00001 [Golovinomyces magnicellulatus]|nr:hypothetical protein Golomagni_00001 [Golovinomyces magnicellulatus]